MATNIRAREPVMPRQPVTPPWMAGILIGMTITTLATGAILLGAGMAIGQAMTQPK